MKPIKPRDFQEFYKQVEALDPAISQLLEARDFKAINDSETYEIFRAFAIVCEHAALVHDILMSRLIGIASCELDLYPALNPDLNFCSQEDEQDKTADTLEKRLKRTSDALLTAARAISWAHIPSGMPEVAKQWQSLQRHINSAQNACSSMTFLLMKEGSK